MDLEDKVNDLARLGYVNEMLVHSFLEEMEFLRKKRHGERCRHADADRAKARSRLLPRIGRRDIVAAVAGRLLREVGRRPNTKAPPHWRGSAFSQGEPQMTRTAANDNNPLYLPETLIAKRILGSAAVTRWTALAALWEREGLPRIDPMTGCRYWPAVRAFLDKRHGLGHAVVPATVDGAENWS